MSFLDRFKKQDVLQPTTPTQPAPPAQPAPARRQVQELTVLELNAILERGETPVLLDVREEWEYKLAHLQNAILIPMNDLPSKLDTFDKDAETIV